LPNDNGYILDFQLDYSKEISISKALGGYEQVNLKVESLEDNSGEIILNLRKQRIRAGYQTIR